MCEVAQFSPSAIPIESQNVSYGRNPDRVRSDDVGVALHTID
jgi:hypothetical protein